ncbi:MAG TPA: TPM domain-containing protein, partial [Chitinophagaceae bacterium]|nr:TPM domain-containing protein [Chitinophagaceae bacterium]
MKKLSLIFLLLISFCAQAQNDKDIPTRPNPPRLVNDFTSTLTGPQSEALERKLVAYDDSTSNQVAIVIIHSLNGYDISDFALRLGRKWGVGGKEFSNGIIILVAKDDHKLRIEIGYGLEGAIPDVTAKSINDNDLTPNFRQENYYRGLDLATDDIFKAAAGEYKAPKGYGSKNKGKIGFGTILILLFILVIIFGGGGRNGGMVSRRGSAGFGTGWFL